MADITDTNLITRIREYLGLRGRVITSSRNSVYPALVINANTQPIPVTVPRTSGGTPYKTYVDFTDDTAYHDLYTVPVGKRALILFASANQTVAAKTVKIETRDSGGTATLRLIFVSGVGFAAQSFATPIELAAGEKVSYIGDAAGDSLGCIYYVEEQL